jgi:regulator of sigma E protease
MLFILGILLFLLLVVIHEYGHFMVAKRNGVEVEEFGIGFPPKIAGRTMGRGIFRSFYTINWLPLGGFVKLKGESDADTRKGSFGAASMWVKAKITMAGVMVNFIAAFVILSGLSYTGMPILIENQAAYGSDTEQVLGPVKVGYIEENTPSASADFELDDIILSANSQEIITEQDMYDFTEANAGREVVIELEREGKTLVQTLTLEDEDNENGYLGVIPYQITSNKSTWSAPINGLLLTAQFTQETLSGIISTIGSLFSGDVSEATENVSGPVGIVVILRNIDSFSIMMTFIGLVSLTLAVMNALPIPALDGGRLFVMLLFRAMKRELTEKTEAAIHGRGMIILLIVVAIVSYVDVTRFL